MIAREDRRIKAAVVEEEAGKIAASQEEAMRQDAEKMVADPEWVARKADEIRRQLELSGTLVDIKRKEEQKKLAQLRDEALAEAREEVRSVVNEPESTTKPREVAVTESQVAPVTTGRPLSAAASMLARRAGMQGSSLTSSMPSNGKIVKINRPLAPDS